MRPIHLLLAAAAPALLTAQDTTGQRPRLSALPVIGSAPETGLQYGATAVRVYRTGPAATTRPSQLQAYAINTAKHQQRAFLQLDRWGPANATRTRLRAEYQRFPLPFFPEGGGQGDTEARYTATGPELSAMQQWRTRGTMYVGLGIRLRDMRASAIDTSEWTLTRPPVIVGNRSATLQGFLQHDSRDNILGPAKGAFVMSTVGLAVSRDRGTLHEQYTFARLANDMRVYRRWSGGVLAARLSGEGIVGKAPFDLLPMAGSDTLLRGYVRGRYRDQGVGAAEVEYRSGYWRRLGYAAFAGVGAAVSWGAREPGEPRGTYLPSVGGGVRYQLQPADRLTIRVDYGRGRNGGGLYVALGEAF